MIQIAFSLLQLAMRISDMSFTNKAIMFLLDKVMKDS